MLHHPYIKDADLYRRLFTYPVQKNKTIMIPGEAALYRQLFTDLL